VINAMRKPGFPPLLQKLSPLMRSLAWWFFFCFSFFQRSPFAFNTELIGFPTLSNVCCAIFGWVFGLKSLDLGLRFIVYYCTTHASPVSLPASSKSTDNLRAPNHRPHIMFQPDGGATWNKMIIFRGEIVISQNLEL
jgi:hypothetical protein